MRSVFLLVPLVVALAQDTPIQPDKIAAHVKVLSSDEYEGRAPGTRAEKKTVDYLVGQFKSFGLEPAGDPGPKGRAWTQDVPLSQADITGPVNASIRSGSNTKQLKQGEDIAIRATHLKVDHTSIKNAPIVFVGYGVKAPERQWDDFKGVDMHGKIGLVLVNDPDFEADLGGRFNGKAMTYYGRWTYKYQEAARQGALGMIVIHETDPASYGWATVKNSNTNTMFDIVRPKPENEHPLVEGWIQRGVAVDIFKAAGLDFEAEKKKAQSQDFKPVALRDTTFSADYRVKHVQVVSKNVVAMKKGTTHADEFVFYTAHWDHLGIGLADAKGDRIYNGAEDNALGTASILEVAHRFASQPATERSVVFLMVTAEEKGLIGSEYYGQKPLYPLAKTVGVYNVDGGSSWGPAKDVAVSGEGRVSLQDDLRKAAEREGRRLSADPKPEAGSFYRSDHFSFAKVGVPAISFKSGRDMVKGGEAEGKRLADEYNEKRYHQPADEYSSTWDLSGQAQDMNLLYSLGRAMANSRTWPEWLQGSEFKAERDKTASERR